MDSKKYDVWLASLPGVGNKRFKQIVNHFGSSKKVFYSNTNEINNLRFLPKEVRKILSQSRSLEKIEAYLSNVDKLGIKILTFLDKEYPKNLKFIYDPPPVIYVKGQLLKEDSNAVGIVGSRKASEYGLKTAEKLAYELAKNNITVISGMALGIDTAAHKGALRAGGRTIAVFGCGLGHVYPKSGLNLSKAIIKNGAIISEYPIGIEPRPEYFPARNRIISGMSLGIVVVEAGIKSGTLITTDFALEQGRDVFSVPGNINSPNSKGTNNLIKNGAKLIDSVEDIIEELSFNNYNYEEEQKNDVESKLAIDSNNKENIPYNNTVESINEENFDNVEFKILKCLLDSGRTLEQIITSTKLNPSEAISTTTLLEIKGNIIQLDNVFYIDKTIEK